MPSYKVLKSVSHNFSHSFISLMNYINEDYFLGHLLKQARATKLSKLHIDILRNEAAPAQLLTTPIRKSIQYWNEWFPTLVENSGATMEFVKSAVMTIEFDLKTTKPHLLHTDVLESPFFCEISITDDRGKEYKHKHEGWWYPEA